MGVDMIRLLGIALFATSLVASAQMDTSLTKPVIHITQIGVMYMFAGAWVQDLHGTSHSEDHTYHVGPHVMIITPHNEDSRKLQS